MPMPPRLLLEAHGNRWVLSGQPRARASENRNWPGLLLAPALLEHRPPSPSWVLAALFAEALEPLIPNPSYLRGGCSLFKELKSPSLFTNSGYPFTSP